MKLLGNLFAVVAVVGVATGSYAQEKGERPLDKDFLVKVASCNNAEIEVSKLADKRAASAEVKDFATMLMKGHKTAQEKLGDLIKNRKIGVATGLEKDVRDEITRLGKLDGKEFDKAFVEHMVRDHKEAIAIFENQAKNGQEADIRDYAKSMLPDLRKHLKMAEDLAKNINK